ncbi:hypothetical protein MNV49_004564 [Pseudohyphozyma bogoriensis]|nr:hypothetical protein MNV49_004564 [Pseudohyphozyma bogoriensis]
MHDHDHDHRPRGPTVAPEDRRTLFVVNLAEGTSSRELGALFETKGPLVRVDIPVEPFKGYGFVQMRSSSDAHRAWKELHRIRFKGRSIELKVS